VPDAPLPLHLYPLGHVPYGRLAVAPVTLDGQVVLSSEREPPPAIGDHRHGAPRSSERRSRRSTTRWSSSTDRRWLATQTPERLARSAALLGLHPGLTAPEAQAIAFRLELPRLVLRQAADAYARARVACGQVLVDVLDQLGADACLSADVN
jgi:hypothetical protein